MLEPGTRIARPVVCALAALVIVGACASTTSPSGSPAASAPPSAQPSTTPVPPTPSPTPGPIAAIKIGDPYALVDNPKNKSLSGDLAFSFDVAGKRVDSTLKGREIRQDGKLVGLVLVVEFGDLRMTPAIFEAAAHGAADSAKGELSFSTILGQRVAFVTTADATFGLFSHGDTVVMVGGPTGTDAESLLTAIIKANA